MQTNSCILDNIEMQPIRQKAHCYAIQREY